MLVPSTKGLIESIDDVYNIKIHALCLANKYCMKPTEHVAWVQNVMNYKYCPVQTSTSTHSCRNQNGSISLQPAKKPSNFVYISGLSKTEPLTMMM